MTRPSHFRTAARTWSLLIAAATAGSLLTTLPAAAKPHPKPHDACVRSLPSGSSELAISYAGESYDVLVNVPAAPSRRALPLVLDLHGSNSNGTSQAAISELAKLGSEKGFIAVNPTGNIAFEHTLPDGNWAWNVPGVPLTSGTYPPAGSRDDIGFLRAVVEQVDAAGCVDDRRVYATGFSGGGRMASALACEASDVFAAIAPVAGLRAGRPDPDQLTQPEAGNCAPERPVAVVTFHGTADFVNPYLGNSDPRWGYTVRTAVESWAELNRCRVEPKTEQVSAGVDRISWSHCRQHAQVVLYEVKEGGHTWPGTSVDLSALGYTTQEISASELMWAFFQAHPRRG